MTLIDADKLSYDEIKAMPVRYAKWEQVDETKQKCTNCEHIFIIMAYPRCNNNFCPQCGTRIEQEEK